MKFLRNTFIPHEENNHHPHFWRKESFFVILFLVFIIEVFIQIDARVLVRRDSFLASILPSVLVSMTNEYRLEAKTNTLAINPLLEEAAKLKAEDMASRGYFAHNTPDGKLPWYWLDVVGYKYEKAGENLAVNFFDSRDVAVAWMNSPTHRANILKDSYTEIGIAMSEGKYKGKSSVFVVQFFGKPKEIGKPSVVVREDRLNSASSTIATTTTASVLDTEVLGASTEVGFFKKIFSSPVNLGEKLLLLVALIVALALIITLVFRNAFLKHKRILATAIILILIAVSFILINSYIFKSSLMIATEISL